MTALPVWLGNDLSFPDPRQALPHPQNGLVALGGDLKPARLIEAYRRGIFPWSARPISWWSPDPRGILELERFRLPRRLRQRLAQQPFQITVNRAFAQVIRQCAEQRGPSTWISPEFVEAYVALHRAGCAHSIECWQEGALVGGVYGVALAGFFAGESMFHRADNASKIALCHLVDRLRRRGYLLFDIQMVTPVTASLGATEISRDEYLRRLELALKRACQFDDCGGAAAPAQLNS